MGRASLVLRGEPGIGKTILWQTAVEEARGLGRRVLVHRAVEAEAVLAFSGLIDLVAPILDEVADALPEPRERALRVALLLEAPRDEPPQPQAVGLALLDVLTALCESGDVVIALDDLQWLDSSTAAVLPLALRRVAGERMRVLATLRDAVGVRAPFELSAVLRRGPSSGDPARRLQPQRPTSPARGQARDRAASTAACPGARALGRQSSVRAGARPHGRPARAASLREALDARVAQLPDETADVLLAAAALARPTLRAVAPGEARQRALVQALDAHVVELDGEVVRFTHPLLASRCYERATPGGTGSAPRARRVGGRRRAARAPPRPRRRGPDDVVAVQLDAAVHNAAARGATAAAAKSRSSPSRSLRATRSPDVVAAHFHHLAGDFARASRLLPRSPRDCRPAPRAPTRSIRGRSSGSRTSRGAFACASKALADAEHDDVRCAQIHGFQAISRWVHGDLSAAVAEARLGLERAERSGRPADDRRRDRSPRVPGGVPPRGHAGPVRARHGD